MNQIVKIKSNRRLAGLTCLALSLFAGAAAAATDQTLGQMATTITASFESVAKLITAGSYMAGLAFAISAIMKFKQHKDNPTNVQIGTPIGLTFIAAALLFLPSILGITGMTMFGGGVTAGPSGTAWVKPGA